MGTSYTKDETLAELTSVLEKGTDFLYKSNPVNWKGCIKGTNIPYTEEIIKELYDRNILVHGVIIDGINEIKREESYYTKSHAPLVNDRNENSNRDEEIFVKELFTNNPFEAELGKVVDFQIPLKDKLDDSAGKIDLLTFMQKQVERVLEHYKADFYEYDTKMILDGLEMGSRYVWLLRKTGTWLLNTETSKDMINAVIAIGNTVAAWSITRTAKGYNMKRICKPQLEAFSK